MAVYKLVQVGLAATKLVTEVPRTGRRSSQTTRTGTRTGLRRARASRYTAWRARCVVAPHHRGQRSVARKLTEPDAHSLRQLDMHSLRGARTRVQQPALATVP